MISGFTTGVAFVKTRISIIIHKSMKNVYDDYKLNKKVQLIALEISSIVYTRESLKTSITF